MVSEIGFSGRRDRGRREGEVGASRLTAGLTGSNIEEAIGSSVFSLNGGNHRLQPLLSW